MYYTFTTSISFICKLIFSPEETFIVCFLKMIGSHVPGSNHLRTPLSPLEDTKKGYSLYHVRHSYNQRNVSSSVSFVWPKHTFLYLFSLALAFQNLQHFC